MKMTSRYSEDVKSFITDNVKGTTTRDLVALVNAKFGTEFTESKMKAYKNNHKLRSGTFPGFSKGGVTELFPENVRAFIKENHIGIGPKEMVELLNKRFKTSYNREQIKNYYARFKLNCGLTGRFEKGHVPANKGKKTGGGPEHARFKKGHVPKSHLPVGSEVIRSDGYLQVKIAEPNVWRLKHLYVWEKVNGPVPKNQCLLFRDGNKQNVDLDNLVLISRRKLVILNNRNLLQNDRDINDTALLVADLIIATADKKKNMR